MRLLLTAAAALAAVLGGCRHDYVRVDDMALGRVVVYRNGVAYYERRATLAGDTLSIRVPRDKVNDFLKSLTVRDARTGRTLPVGFPSPTAPDHGGMVNMVIDLPRRSATDLILTYITEAPAWKPSYRVVINRDGVVKLQGWAIVDNTSGEDWKDVRVGVGSSSALSFRYDLWSVRLVERETLSSNDRFAIAPPTGDSPYGGADKDARTIAVADEELPRPDSHPDVQKQYWQDEIRAESKVKSSGAGKSGHRVARKPPERDVSRKVDEGKKKVAEAARTIRERKNRWVVEGYARPGEANAEGRALDRANLMRNRLIEEGVPPAQVEVRVGTGTNQPAGVRLVELAAPVADEPAGRAARGGRDDEQPVGESHFESRTPMTVERERSVMVSIVDRSTPGETVYLYDSESERGNPRFAFKAIRFVNPTRSALEAGPVTVYNRGGFVGEGLTEPIPAAASAVVPYALDRQIAVDRQQKAEDRITRLVSLERGVLTSEVAYTRRSSYEITNRLGRPVVVYLRHTVEPGWRLASGPGKAERLGDAHLFRVELAARATRAVAIEESTPMTRTLDLRSPAALDLVAVYLSRPVDDPGLAGPMKELLGLHRQMADQQQAIDSLRQRLDDYRVRMDELHAQIVTLQAVKSGGSLMKHLKQKMQEISERIQKGTIELVDREEKVMLARVHFQDAVAELTLAKASTTASAR
jgi:hypothetical protein